MGIMWVAQLEDSQEQRESSISAWIREGEYDKEDDVLRSGKGVIIDLQHDYEWFSSKNAAIDAAIAFLNEMKD